MPRSHAVFAAGYAAVAAVGERTGYGRWRREALAGARGRLLIVGLGPGHDLSHLPPDVTAVVAVEPDRYMRRRAAGRIRRASVPVSLVGGVGEELPLRTASVDAILVSLVLCTVPDPARTAAELRRVLRPGGTLHVLEHVHAAPATRLRRWQDWLDPVWCRVAGGCHVTRDTREVLARAGFETAGLRDTHVRAVPPPVAPHLIGTAL